MDDAGLSHLYDCTHLVKLTPHIKVAITDEHLLFYCVIWSLEHFCLSFSELCHPQPATTIKIFVVFIVSKSWADILRSLCQNHIITHQMLAAIASVNKEHRPSVMCDTNVKIQLLIWQPHNLSVTATLRSNQIHCLNAAPAWQPGPIWSDLADHWNLFNLNLELRDKTVTRHDTTITETSGWPDTSGFYSRYFFSYSTWVSLTWRVLRKLFVEPMHKTEFKANNLHSVMQRGVPLVTVTIWTLITLFWLYSFMSYKVKLNVKYSTNAKIFPQSHSQILKSLPQGGLLCSRQQIKYGSYFFIYLYDITAWDDDMTWRGHETRSGHGIMSRTAWQSSWQYVTGCSKVQWVPLLLHCTIVCNIRVYSTWEHLQKSWTCSFIRLSVMSIQVWCLGIDIRWLVLYGYGHVVMCPAIMRPVWVWPVSTARPEDPGWSLLRSGDHCQERDGAVISDVTAWHVMCDVRCSYWRPTSLTGRSRPALGILIAWLLRPSASRWIILESPHSSWCSNILFLWLINIQLQGNACAPAS